jgi:hypothetical protein
MCEECRDTHTIPGWELHKAYSIPYGLFKDLRSHETTSWNAATRESFPVWPWPEELVMAGTAVQQLD